MSAQTLEFGVYLDSDLRLEPELWLKDLEADEGRVSLRLAGGVAGPLEVGVRARENTSFGPLGNAALYSALDVSAAGLQARFGAEGVIASVAAEAELGLRTLAPGSFSAEELYSQDVFPFSKQAGARLYLDLGASYRLSRSLVLSARPAFSFTEGEGFGLTFSGDARLVRFVGPDDLYLRALGQLGSSDTAFGTAGVRYDLNRRGLPNIVAALYVGVTAQGFVPGGTLELSQWFRDLGVQYSLTLAAEPYRVDRLPYRASLSYTQTLGPGELIGSLYGTLDNPFEVPPLRIKLAYALAL